MYIIADRSCQQSCMNKFIHMTGHIFRPLLFRLISTYSLLSHCCSCLRNKKRDFRVNHAIDTILIRRETELGILPKNGGSLHHSVRLLYPCLCTRPSQALCLTLHQPRIVQYNLSGYNDRLFWRIELNLKQLTLIRSWCSRRDTHTCLASIPSFSAVAIMQE